jgi:ABC-type phosphate/phosphonate transport system ATPase subunit
MAGAARRVRELVAEVALAPDGVVAHRTVLWNALAGAGGPGRLGGWLRIGGAGRRRAALDALEEVELRAHPDALASSLDADGRVALALARALALSPECLVLREPDGALGAAGVERLLERLRRLAGTRRVLVLATLASPALARRFADRLLVIADGALVFDGPPAAARPGRIPARPGGLAEACSCRLEEVPWLADAVRVRRWDDEAKVPDAQRAPLADHGPALARRLGVQSDPG